MKIELDVRKGVLGAPKNTGSVFPTEESYYLLIL